MRIQRQPPLHLTYCLSVHGGETWDEAFSAIRCHVPAIRRMLGRGEDFGLGLRLSGRAASELAAGGRLAEFKRHLADHGLYVFTINGFPYGAFHGTRVKEHVYEPDWRRPERLDYTCLLSDILAGLLPEGVSGSISTVPGSYKAWVTSDRDVRDMARNLATCAAHMADVCIRTGREIHLGLEPEPDCFIETTAEAIAFFTGPLLREGTEWLQERTGCTRGEAEDALRRHVGLCVDTCHMAVGFESLADSLARLATARIRISKVQLSSALRVEGGAAARRRLGAFCDRVYLHQVKTRAGSGGMGAFPDLEPALEHGGDATDATEWRVHCHVPLYFDRDGELESTNAALTPDFFRALRGGATEHLEIETYTFNVLPKAIRDRGVCESVAEEYRWVLRRLETAGGG